MTTRSSPGETGVAGSEDIVGRALEVTILDGALERAARGSPVLTVIEAAAGMGKSALIETFLAGCRDAVLVARQVVCAEPEQSLPFGVAGLILQEEIPPACSGVEVGRRLLSWLGERQERAERGVVVLVVDDAQWMDRESAEVLQFVMRRLDADRVLCLIGQRPAPGHGGTTFDAVQMGSTSTTVIRLGPLDAAAVTELADRARSWSLSADTAAQLTASTGGVPLLVAAIIRGASEPAQLVSADAPASVAHVTRRLLGALDDPGRRLAEAAAVLAEPTEIAVLGEIAELADPTAALESATAGGLLALDREGWIVCTHALLQDSIRDTVPLTRRRELHARAVSWTSGNRQLFHRAVAADRPDPLLLADLVDGAREARRARNFGLSAAHSLLARSVCGAPGHRDRLLLEALLDRVQAQDLAGAQALVAAATEAPPSELRSRALGLLGRERGHIGPARTWLRQALDLATQAADPDAVTRAALANAVLHVRMGEGSAAVKVLGYTAAVDDPELSTDVLTTRAMGLWQTHALDDAVGLLENVAITSEGTAWGAEMVATRGMFALFGGRPAESLADLDTAVRLAHLWRPSTNQSRIHGLRSLARYLLGDWDGAAVDAAAARALAPTNAEAWSAALALGTSVPIAANRGQFDDARHYLARARDALPDWAPDVIALHVRAAEVVLAQARDDHPGVLAALEPVRAHGRWVVPTRVGHELLRARIAALAELGRPAEAEADLRRYEAVLEQVPDSPYPRRLHWLRGLVAEASGRLQLAREHYAIELTDAHLQQTPFLLAQVLRTSGRLERLLGNRHDAVDLLSQARDIFATLEAAPFLERCRTDLAPRGLAVQERNPDGLTPRERDVAGLVRLGYTNKEVASELFLTAKTVEFHLRNIYIKLGVAGRQQLRRMHKQ